VAALRPRRRRPPGGRGLRHLRGHRRHGPRAIPETPHGAVLDLPLYRQAEFCAPCHQFDDPGVAVNGKHLEDTYREWQGSRHAREGRTCQACHMPEGYHGFKGSTTGTCPETRSACGPDASPTA
jgi:hypothetical protein